MMQTVDNFYDNSLDVELSCDACNLEKNNISLSVKLIKKSLFKKQFSEDSVRKEPTFNFPLGNVNKQDHGTISLKSQT